MNQTTAAADRPAVTIPAAAHNSGTAHMAGRWATQLTAVRACPDAATLTLDSAVQVAVAWTLAVAGRPEPVAEAVGLHGSQLLNGQVRS